ncbi:MAG: oxidoreductase domain protein, partial [Chthonomonadales bacterium]|nr:oxidoreductase domain protein [Chthonomonadales bacterium]
MTKAVKIGLIGLGFGAEFIPIYQNHPDAEMYAICRRNKAELDKAGDKFGVMARYTEF